MERASGVLMHITSLPQSEGIGTFGESAYRFADFLKKTKQKYWQILPLTPIGYGNSPYQAFSAFAGNPYLIDLQKLIDDGILPKDEKICLIDSKDNAEKIEFEVIYDKKMKLLQKAYELSKTDENLIRKLERFKLDNIMWLEDYSLFMALKETHNQVSWQEWNRPLKYRNKEILETYREALKDRIEFWDFLQYEFFKQWFELKSYVNHLGIKIIGDIPIYVSTDSSDTWSHPELFKLDKECQPITVAGCPPDIFTEDGQLWGNPIYNWEYLKSTKYEWWIERMKHNSMLYDMVRIDHFRGFEAFWEVPFTEETARNGKWTKGPGYELFEAINKALGDMDIIAEDLGFITREVIELREKTGYPGMSIMQFAFDMKEDSNYLPHNCEKESVAYLGTHDNETIIGWMQNSSHVKEVKFARDYLRISKREGYEWGFIRGLWASPAKLAIVQMQDLLGLDNSARMNIPSTVGDNWNWRMKDDAINEEIIGKLKKLTRLYGRMASNNE